MKPNKIYTDFIGALESNKISNLDVYGESLGFIIAESQLSAAHLLVQIENYFTALDIVPPVMQVLTWNTIIINMQSHKYPN